MALSARGRDAINFKGFQDSSRLGKGQSRLPAILGIFPSNISSAAL